MSSIYITELVNFIKTNATVLGVMIDFIIGGFLIVISYKATRIAKNQNNIASRKAYLSVYKKLGKAFSLVSRDGDVTDEARALFWQARDRARLELPKNIERYTQDLFDKMMKAHRLYSQLYGEGSLPVGEKRNKIASQNCAIIKELMEEHPHLIFRNHMKVK